MQCFHHWKRGTGTTQMYSRNTSRKSISFLDKLTASSATAMSDADHSKSLHLTPTRVRNQALKKAFSRVTSPKRNSSVATQLPSDAQMLIMVIFASSRSETKLATQDTTSSVYFWEYEDYRLITFLSPPQNHEHELLSVGCQHIMNPLPTHTAFFNSIEKGTFFLDFGKSKNRITHSGIGECRNAQFEKSLNHGIPKCSIQEIEKFWNGRSEKSQNLQFGDSLSIFLPPSKGSCDDEGRRDTELSDIYILT